MRYFKAFAPGHTGLGGRRYAPGTETRDPLWDPAVPETGVRFRHTPLACWDHVPPRLYPVLREVFPAGAVLPAPGGALRAAGVTPGPALDPWELFFWADGLRAHCADGQTVTAGGWQAVYAPGGRVHAGDSCVVYAWGDAEVWADDDATVEARGGARIVASGRARVHCRVHAGPVLLLGDALLSPDRGTRVEALGGPPPPAPPGAGLRAGDRADYEARVRAQLGLLDAPGPFDGPTGAPRPAARTFDDLF